MKKPTKPSKSVKVRAWRRAQSTVVRYPVEFNGRIVWVTVPE